MSDIDSRRSELSLINTPDRIERIEKLFCYLRIKPVNGVNSIVFEFTEDIITTVQILQTASFIAETEVDERGGDAVKYLPGKLTRFFRDMLIYGVAKFATEADAEMTVGEKEVACFEEGMLNVYRLGSQS
jgi:hypothetical protein